MCEERQRTHFFLAGFLRAEASFGAAEEDEEAAALGGTLVETEVDFADADVEFVEDGVAAGGPSAALVPEDMAGFCKEVRLKLNFVQFVFELPASCSIFQYFRSLILEHSGRPTGADQS